MLPWTVARLVVWAQAHHLYFLEFEERGVTLWTFIRTWEKDTFRRVAETVSDQFCSDATHELSVFGSVVAAVGSLASPVAVFVESHVLADTYGDFLGSGYDRKLVEYPIFDLILLKRCLQKVSFPSLDLWIRFPWRNFSSHDWRGQRIAAGWCHFPVFVVPLSQQSCLCRHFLRSWATSWVCGLSSWSTSRRLGEGLTATT